MLVNRAHNFLSKEMPNDDLQIAYDDAVFAFTQGDYTSAIKQFETILAQNPEHFEARLSLGMAHYRLDDYKRAIAEGHKAEELNPKEQRVHTNLSLFYMKNGDKEKSLLLKIVDHIRSSRALNDSIYACGSHINAAKKAIASLPVDSSHQSLDSLTDYVLAQSININFNSLR